MTELGYTRAYLDRAASPADRPLRFVMATEGPKADGIDLRLAGADLSRFRANPVVGYGHCYYGRNDLPIGRADNVEIDGKRMLCDVEFDMADDFAAKVDRKYRDGFLNAVSIGFDVVEWGDDNGNYRDGGVAAKWELFELSVVPLPMDGKAVVDSGRVLNDDLLRQWLKHSGLEPEFVIEWIQRATRKSVSPAAVERHPLSLYRALSLAQG